MQRKYLLAAAGLIALSACGDTIGEQAAVGAAAGAGTALLLDGDVLLGAAGGVAANVAFCQANPSRCDDAGTPL